MLDQVSPSVFTALEHERIPISPRGGGFGFTPGEVEQLTQLGELRRGFCEVGQGQVKLAQYCGVVGLGGRILEILPKTQARSGSREDCCGVLLRLLRLAGTFPHFRHKATGQATKKMPLLEAFISTFFDNVATIVRGGLLKQYFEIAEDLRVVRGRISLTRQIAALCNRPDVIACEYDELTVDNAWNRTLKCAIRCTRPWISSVDLGRRWTELMGTLDEVSDLSVTRSDLIRLTFNRHADRYREAITWARWILTLLSPSLRAGASEAPALLFDMNRLFESAVANVLQKRSITSSGMTVSRQDSSCTLATLICDGQESAAFPLRPDLVVRRGPHVVGILDTKWKLICQDSKGRVIPSEDDMYQMTAYALAFGCRRLALIYPLPSGRLIADTSEFRLPTPGGSLVHVIGIDVGDDALPVGFGTVPVEMVPLLDGLETSRC